VLATLKLRQDQLVKFRRLAKIDTDAALAAAMKMDAGTISRNLHGLTSPSAVFIANLVAAFDGLTLDDLFEVIDDEVAA
jgi:transcriptional regulator with XRE-family HTH domain